MKISVIIQARMASTRLPGKILKPVMGKPLLEHMIDRLGLMQTIDDIIVATTSNPTDDCVEQLARERGVGCFRGSEGDVLERVLLAAKTHHVDLIVETTGDCPLIDPVESDRVVRLFLDNACDHTCNFRPRTYPRGMDTQVFSTRTLEDVSRRTNDPVDREHVSYYIYQHPEVYRLGNVTAPKKLRRPDLRLTVDTPEDFLLIENVIESLWPNKPDFSLGDIIEFLDGHPELVKINQSISQKKVSYA